MSALVRVIYKNHVATCYNPTDGDVSRLGISLLNELDQANNRIGGWNEYINLLKKMEVVIKNQIPTEEQKLRLMPYTHIRLDQPDSANSWSSLLYGTRGGFDAMLRAGIYCDNMLFCTSVGTVYTIDLFSRTINVMCASMGSQQTYRADETMEPRLAWSTNMLWLPDADSNHEE